MGEHNSHLLIFLPIILFLFLSIIRQMRTHLNLKVISVVLFIMLFSLHIFGAIHISEVLMSHDHSFHQCCIIPLAVETPTGYLFFDHFLAKEFTVSFFLSHFFLTTYPESNKSPPLFV